MLQRMGDDSPELSVAVQKEASVPCGAPDGGGLTSCSFRRPIFWT